MRLSLAFIKAHEFSIHNSVAAWDLERRLRSGMGGWRRLQDAQPVRRRAIGAGCSYMDDAPTQSTVLHNAYLHIDRYVSIEV